MKIDLIIEILSKFGEFIARASLYILVGGLASVYKFLKGTLEIFWPIIKSALVYIIVIIVVGIIILKFIL